MAGLYNISKSYKSSKARVQVIDVYGKFNEIIADPSSYGLDPDEIRTACLVGAYGEGPRSLCDDPDKHLWFDAYHPTRVGHKIVAGVFKAALSRI